jgi:vacuolar-type H+-ATPase subunit F/Vma7
MSKKISIVVREETPIIMSLFGINKFYKVMSQRNILLPKFLTEEQLNNLLDGDIDILIK